jgi:hypothetical protein
MAHGLLDCLLASCFSSGSIPSFREPWLQGIRAAICHHSYNTVALFVQQGNPAPVQRSRADLVETPERDLDVMTRALARTREGLNEKAFGEKCPNRVVWTDIGWYQQGPDGHRTALQPPMWGLLYGWHGSFHGPCSIPGERTGPTACEL